MGTKFVRIFLSGRCSVKIAGNGPRVGEGRRLTVAHTRITTTKINKKGRSQTPLKNTSLSHNPHNRMQWLIRLRSTALSLFVLRT